MAANVETMFYTREKPWHGLGTKVMEAPSSKEALIVSRLDWKVYQKSVQTSSGDTIMGYKANVRSNDGKVLGIVTDKYRVIQNEEAFEFTDTLLGEGVRYETAGSLQGGKRVWLLARLPEGYKTEGEEIMPYLVFTNSHDGSGAVRVAITPIRVVCQNTLNWALKDAKRVWAVNHIGNINTKLVEARDTLQLAGAYMKSLTVSIDELRDKQLSDRQIFMFINDLFPVADDMTSRQKENIEREKEDLIMRFNDAPDLQNESKNGYRFINAVSDYATHSAPIRQSANYRENLFARTIDGHPLIDRAYKMAMAA